MKEKTIFLVYKVLSFRDTRQGSKNVADTTFNFEHVIVAWITTFT